MVVLPYFRFGAAWLLRHLVVSLNRLTGKPFAVIDGCFGDAEILRVAGENKNASYIRCALQFVRISTCASQRGLGGRGARWVPSNEIWAWAARRATTHCALGPLGPRLQTSNAITPIRARRRSEYFLAPEALAFCVCLCPCCARWPAAGRSPAPPRPASGGARSHGLPPSRPGAWLCVHLRGAGRDLLWEPPLSLLPLY
jgi:hypothetical protein